MQKQILIAPNAFKNCLSAVELAGIIKNVIYQSGRDFSCQIAPIADGGDGTIDVINSYFKESRFITTNVHDPLFRPIKTKWLLLNKDIAIVELSKASGIALLGPEELDPYNATTFGTGELVKNVLDFGCKKIIITLGGSATIEAGLGLLSALGVDFLDEEKLILKPVMASLSRVQSIDLSKLDSRLQRVKLDVLSDVQNSLLGKNGVKQFFKQKGVKEEEFNLLETNINHFANIVQRHINNDKRFDLMGGSAGGVAFSLMTLLDADVCPGFQFFSKLVSMEDIIKKTDTVITGEGSLDSQTLMGKAVYELAKLARNCNKKVIALCGQYDKSINWNLYNINKVIQIMPDNGTVVDSLRNAKSYVEFALRKHIDCL